MADESTFVEPLTRGNYKRLPKVECQITNALILEPEVLVKRAQQREENASDFLSAEALVYFIRRAICNGDTKTRDALFRELFERCKPHFGGKFRGFRPEEREDLQSEVIEKIIDDLFATDDRADFMEVKFWSYLENKSIDACRKALRHIDDTESLDTNYSNNDVFEGQIQLQKVVDPRLLPEELAMISEGLAKLPPDLRQVFLLRHYVGMKIDSKNSAETGGDEPTIAAHFSCSGRTIQNKLKEAYRLLPGFRGKHNGE